MLENCSEVANVGDEVTLTYHDKPRAGVVEAVTVEWIKVLTVDGYRTFRGEKISDFRNLSQDSIES